MLAAVQAALLDGTAVARVASEAGADATFSIKDAVSGTVGQVLVARRAIHLRAADAAPAWFANAATVEAGAVAGATGIDALLDLAMTSLESWSALTRAMETVPAAIAVRYLALGCLLLTMLSLPSRVALTLSVDTSSMAVAAGHLALVLAHVALPSLPTIVAGTGAGHVATLTGAEDRALGCLTG